MHYIDNLTYIQRLNYHLAFIQYLKVINPKIEKEEEWKNGFNINEKGHKVNGSSFVCSGFFEFLAL